jgi:putative ABC transport system ATP-binding protein
MLFVSNDEFAKLREIPLIGKLRMSALARIDRLRKRESSGSAAESHANDCIDQGMLRIDDLTFAYNTEPVLRGCTLHARRGETVLVRGASGSGKSTLLRLVARLEDVPRGAIRIDGVEVNDLPAAAYRRRVAYLQQLPVMIEGSVRDNLLLAFRYSGKAAPDDDELSAWLESVELADLRLDGSASELSVGQQQRLALLRLLSLQPELLLLDEPTASLDAESATLLLQAVTRRQAERPLTVLLVAHQDLPLDGRNLRFVRMRDGRIVEEDANANSRGGGVG